MRERRPEGDHGFTIMELMVVILIMGILALTAFASYHAVTARAARAACLSNQRTLIDALGLYQVNHEGEVPNTTDIDFLSGYATKWEYISVCPLDGAPLTFDASTRTIICPNHPFP